MTNKKKKNTNSFLLFFLSSALLTGCSTNYNYPSKNISVLKKSGALKEYELLSVRGDTAIIVLDWAENNIKPISFSHAEAIKNDSIVNVFRNSEGVSKALVGAGVGLGAGIIEAIILLHAKPDFIIDSRGAEAFAAIIFSTLGGTLIGLIVDGWTTMDLSLTSTKDREFLRSISLYPDKEPEEMKYIK